MKHFKSLFLAIPAGFLMLFVIWFQSIWNWFKMRGRIGFMYLMMEMMQAAVIGWCDTLGMDFPIERNDE